jgi:hypothetical protein
MLDPNEEDPAELEAKSHDMAFVKLTGNIGCMVNGAGLAMATMDAIAQYGANQGAFPANFLDVGGGATAEKVTTAFKIILKDPSVEAILVNIFGGIMKCDTIANGVLTAVKEVGLDRPLVVRLEGTNVELGKKIIAESGLAVIAAEDLKDGCIKAAKAANDYRVSKGLARRAALPEPAAIAYVPKKAAKLSTKKTVKKAAALPKKAKKSVRPPAHAKTTKKAVTKQLKKTGKAKAPLAKSAKKATSARRATRKPAPKKAVVALVDREGHARGRPSPRRSGQETHRTDSLRPAYREAMRNHIAGLRKLAMARNIDYALARTDCSIFELFDHITNI